MRKLKLFKNPKFNRPAVLALAIIILVIEVVAPTIGQIASQRALRLASIAQKEAALHPNQALIDYRVAMALSPSNRNIAHALADLYVSQNRPDDAIATLKRLPIEEGGFQIATVQKQSGRLSEALKTLKLLDQSVPAVPLTTSQILLEEGRVGEATRAAERALASDPRNTSSQLQLGLCYAISGNTAALNSLMASVTSPQVIQSLNRAQQGKTAQAYELYAQGLLRSSRTILIQQANLAASEYRLLGQIDLSLGANDSSKLTEAEVMLIKATQNDPASPDGHQLLQKVYAKIGDKDKARHEEDLVEQLESGKV